MNAARLLHPRSIAVVGATERAGSYGGEALLNLRRLEFPGNVYGVNPGREQVHGFPCVAERRRACPRPSTPSSSRSRPPAAPAAVEAIGARGCGGAVVFAAGFAESAGGGALQDELVAAAHAHDLPVCGPNGNGIVSLPARMALWGDMVAPREAGPGRADLPERQRRRQRARLAPRPAAAHRRLVRQPGRARGRRLARRGRRAGRRALGRALPRGRRRRRALVRGARALRARRASASRC